MQSAATQQAPRSARDVLFDSDTATVNQIEVDLNAPRFVVQMGWNTLHVDTSAVPNRYMLRGEITPVRSYRQKANIYEIRTGELIEGSEEQDSDGRIVYGSYWRRAFHEAQRLLDNDSAAMYKNGIVEITALNSVKSQLYKDVNLNTLFYSSWPMLPERNSDLKSLLEERLIQLKHQPPEGVDDYWLPVIFEIGAQLVKAVDRADFIQQARLTSAHIRMKLSPGEEGRKSEYDSVDYEMLQRTGLPQIHSAEIATAQALEKLTDRTGDNSTLIAMMEGQNKLIDLLSRQVEQQGKILESLLVDRNVKPQRSQSDNKKSA